MTIPSTAPEHLLGTRIANISTLALLQLALVYTAGNCRAPGQSFDNNPFASSSAVQPASMHRAGRAEHIASVVRRHFESDPTAPSIAAVGDELANGAVTDFGPLAVTTVWRKADEPAPQYP